jgi:hypothetical protein
MNRRSRCIELLRRYKEACNNPNFDLPNHPKFLADCERDPPLAQLGRCVDLRRSFQHHCSDLWDERVPGGHAHFLERLNDLERECRRRFEKAQSERQDRSPRAPTSRPLNTVAVAVAKRPPPVRGFQALALAEANEQSSSQEERDQDHERGVEDEDENEDVADPAPETETVDAHALKTERRRRARLRRNRERSELISEVRELQLRHSSEDAEMELLRDVVAETSLSALREQLSERYHVDNSQIESYVRRHKRFVVLVIRFGRETDASAAVTTAAEGCMWEFSPDVSDPGSGQTERRSGYRYRETMLQISTPRLDAHLRGLLTPDGPGTAMDEELRRTMFLEEYERVEVGSGQIQRFFFSSVEQSVLALLRLKLVLDESRFKETSKLPIYRIAHVAGAWEIGESGPIPWLCDLDELRGVFEASAPENEFDLCERYRETIDRTIERSADLLRLEGIFLQQKIATTLRPREEVERLLNTLRATAPSLMRREIGELEAALAILEREVAADVPLARQGLIARQGLSSSQSRHENIGSVPAQSQPSSSGSIAATTAPSPSRQNAQNLLREKIGHLRDRRSGTSLKK